MRTLVAACVTAVVAVVMTCLPGPAASALVPVRVAIVDSGADLGHPALAPSIAAAVDCVGAGGHTSCRPGGDDDSGHGTHVAGIVHRVAPGAQLLVVRSMREECDHDGCRAIGRVDDIVAGVRWAIDNDADVVNLAIDAGVPLDWKDGAVARAIRDAWDAGVVVVASTGNGGHPLDDAELASVPAVFVGALDKHGRPATYGNAPGEARWGVLAPGGEGEGDCPSGGILSTFPRSIAAAGYDCLTGTSMAAAYVSGAIATLLDRGLDPEGAVGRLLITASDLGRPGDDPTYGAGVVDLATATRQPSSAAGSEATSREPARIPVPAGPTVAVVMAAMAFALRGRVRLAAGRAHPTLAH